MNIPIKNLILDMDGVLWRGETPMPGLVAFFDTLRAGGIGFVLATNNATKTAAMYTERLARFGVDVPPHQILTSAEATASYLADLYEPGSPLYVIGAMGLHDALTAQGFEILSAAAVRAGAALSLTPAQGLRNLRGLLWGYSSAGRALAWHARGRRFDPV